MRILDTAMALRVVYLLITPIERTDAFRLGLIDADGKTVRKAVTPEEKNATSPLHRLCWNLKRLISLVPGGATRIGSLTAAYMLMKESYEADWDEATLNENFVLRFPALCESDIANTEIEILLDKLSEILEDAPANATGASVSTDTPNKMTLVRRKKTKSVMLPENPC